LDTEHVSEGIEAIEYDLQHMHHVARLHSVVIDELRQSTDLSKEKAAPVVAFGYSLGWSMTSSPAVCMVSMGDQPPEQSEHMRRQNVPEESLTMLSLLSDGC